MCVCVCACPSLILMQVDWRSDGSPCKTARIMNNAGIVHTGEKDTCRLDNNTCAHKSINQIKNKNTSGVRGVCWSKCMRACVRDREAEGEDVKGPLPGQYFPKEYWDVCT